MKKIMFNDKYGLTDAVLQERKTMTRRVIRNLLNFDPRQDWAVWGIDDKGKANIAIFHNETYKYSIYPQYQPGEVVAVAQSYKDAGIDPHFLMFQPIKGSTYLAEMEIEAMFTGGWNNKMFVRADLMPHQIRITDIKVERLQDISEEDLEKEGVECYLDIIAEKGASKYEKHAEEECWIAGGDGENHYDQSISYCRNCADKIAKKENKEKGYGEWDNYYHRDGGWGQEHDRSSLSCEECGKPLLFDYIPTFFDDDIEELCLDDISDLYLLNQMLHDCDDEIREKAIQRLARLAFAALINSPGVGRKGLWESNPYVFVYSFELLK